MPSPILLTPKAPETWPPRVRVREAATLQMLAPPSARGQFKVRSAVAVLRSISKAAAPKVRVLPALMVTGPLGFSMTIPAQVRSAPRTVVLAEVTVLFQLATSVVAGATPPTQLPPRPRSVAVSFLTTGTRLELITRLSAFAERLRLGVVPAAKFETVRSEVAGAAPEVEPQVTSG